MANADTLDGAGVNSGNALDAAKLQNNSETAKDKEPKRALETVVPGDGSPFKATAVSSVDGAKVLNNLETTKDLAKKELPPSSHMTLT